MKRFADIFKNGCVIFTAVTLIFYSVGGIISGGNREFIPSLKFIWLFFAFSLLLSLANGVLKVSRLNIALRLALHFISSFAIYFVTVILCGGFIKNGSQTLVAMFLFFVLYVIIAVVAAIFSAAFSRKKKSGKKSEKNYKKQF